MSNTDQAQATFITLTPAENYVKGRKQVTENDIIYRSGPRPALSPIDAEIEIVVAFIYNGACRTDGTASQRPSVCILHPSRRNRATPDPVQLEVLAVFDLGGSYRADRDAALKFAKRIVANARYSHDVRAMEAAHNHTL